MRLPKPSGMVSRLKPLAACVVLAAPAATAATTWTVNTCSEGTSGGGTSGSLRYAVANAASGDVIDMTGLACSSISLQTGAIAINQADLTLNGPGTNNLSITGKFNTTIEQDRVIDHLGTGTLNINNLSIAYGYLHRSAGNAAGGCIYSSGSVFLNHVRVYACSASVDSSASASDGGGIFTVGELSMTNCRLEGNSARGGASSLAVGGGAFVNGQFYSNNSTISNNTASAAAGTEGNGGGLFLGGIVTINGSTISGNSSGRNQGGIDIVTGSPSSMTVTITNSTISGNHAANIVGGVYSNAGTITLRNSTIAFNTAGIGRYSGSGSFSYFAPGMALAGSGGALSATLQSTLIANNIYGSGSEYDLSTAGTDTFTFAGANNLVRTTFAKVPADTIKSSCPLLGPLSNNGGPTQTHALLSHSPGIDVGNNAANLIYDQRGSPDARVSGGAADIGAYEVQQVEIIFNNGFDACP
jgi:hypothetical protein